MRSIASAQLQLLDFLCIAHSKKGTPSPRPPPHTHTPLHLRGPCAVYNKNKEYQMLSKYSLQYFVTVRV